MSTRRGGRKAGVCSPRKEKISSGFLHLSKTFVYGNEIMHAVWLSNDVSQYYPKIIKKIFNRSFIHLLTCDKVMEDGTSEQYTQGGSYTFSEQISYIKMAFFFSVKPGISRYSNTQNSS